ncbi:hypothetical protein [Mycoplasma nasistruthionis]|uniref:Uncharacterized protein n=1 Tax=Mycoplasma nasistruthionis TaxID=353852 RepID=A0A4Y6I6G5_9MOLU|nr:hypothetical protein [Mycoplasma nasistruthionis]QCZ36497.1 hypothetical protein FG904_00470 [Mycoplasma nasistruthionis]QDF64789.1 hypothetical protein FIV53_00455 [Mycoplasma nasistruthionis]
MSNTKNYKLSNLVDNFVNQHSDNIKIMVNKIRWLTGKSKLNQDEIYNRLIYEFSQSFQELNQAVENTKSTQIRNLGLHSNQTTHSYLKQFKQDYNRNLSFLQKTSCGNCEVSEFHHYLANFQKQKTENKHRANQTKLNSKADLWNNLKIKTLNYFNRQANSQYQFETKLSNNFLKLNKIQSEINQTKQDNLYLNNSYILNFKTPEIDVQNKIKPNCFNLVNHFFKRYLLI